VDAPSEATAQTGWREARARQGEASIKDRSYVSPNWPPRRCRATPPRRGGEYVPTGQGSRPEARRTEESGSL